MRERRPQKAGGLLVAGVAALGLAVAALSRLGLDATASGLLHGEMVSATWRGEFSAVFLLLLALGAALVIDLEPEFKALAALLTVGALIQIKAPPLSNLIAFLPIVKLFDNTGTTPELTLSICFLAAAALARLAKEDFRKRTAAAAKIFLCLILLAGGCFFARAIGPFMTRALPTAIYSPAGSEASNSFMGPESAKAFAGATEPFRAWSPLSCVSAAIAAVSGGQVRASVPAEILSSFGECDLYGLLPLPVQPGDFEILAKIALPNGSSRILIGPEVATLKVPIWPLAAAAITVPLAAVVPAAGVALYAASAVSWAAAEAPLPTSPSQFPFQLPGIKRLQGDPSLFRIDSFDYSFLEADYANLYGIPDIRNGGDNLDVLPTVYFNFLTRSLIGDPSSNSASQAQGLRLLGLANIKYFVDAPNVHAASPSLKEVYSGPDMSIHENAFSMPRASFFSKAVEVPIADIRDWNAGRELAFKDVPQLLSTPGFNPQKTLILNDPPGEKLAESNAVGGKGGKTPVQILSYEPNRVILSVKAPASGYVFLADNDFPGWEASVDGKSSRIHRADLAFRAVRVPAGPSKIVFSYDSLAIKFGTAVTALGLTAWLVLFLWRGPSLKDSPQADSAAALNFWTARALRWLLLGLMIPAMTFWSLWGLFVFGGGIQNRFNRPAPLSSVPFGSMQSAGGLHQTR